MHITIPKHLRAQPRSSTPGHGSDTKARTQRLSASNGQTTTACIALSYITRKGSRISQGRNPSVRSYLRIDHRTIDCTETYCAQSELHEQGWLSAIRYTRAIADASTLRTQGIHGHMCNVGTCKTLVVAPPVDPIRFQEQLCACWLQHGLFAKTHHLL